MYSCKQCKFKTLNKEYFLNHLNRRHKIDDIIYSCTSCKFNTNEKYSLAIHIAAKHKSDYSLRKKYKGITNNKNTVLTQIRKSSRVRKPSTIKQPDVVQNKNRLKSITILKRKRNFTEKNFVNSRSSKLLHQIKIIFSCEHCNYSTKLKRKLKKHIKSEHLQQDAIYEFKDNEVEIVRDSMENLMDILIGEDIDNLPNDTVEKIGSELLEENDLSLEYDANRSLSSRYKTIVEEAIGSETEFEESQRDIDDLCELSNNIIIYSCANCGFKSKSKSKLQRHIIFIHSETACCKFCKRQNKIRNIFDKNMNLCRSCELFLLEEILE